MISASKFVWLFGIGDSGTRDESDMIEGAGER